MFKSCKNVKRHIYFASHFKLITTHTISKDMLNFCRNGFDLRNMLLNITALLFSFGLSSGREQISLNVITKPCSQPVNFRTDNKISFNLLCPTLNIFFIVAFLKRLKRILMRHNSIFSCMSKRIPNEFLGRFFLSQYLNNNIKLIIRNVRIMFNPISVVMGIDHCGQLLRGHSLIFLNHLFVAIHSSLIPPAFPRREEVSSSGV